ncbi:hypothetical protein [Lignipirellula cremea]|uniref:Uncharacterized protein n=1 Tax=Lignipirellula cremea TaxID=2528010 RepID=A0A518DZR0_9BACT|nr:hypothetical protein [Lignipirellula cremea]QDU97328.1 hypothetical protein Pla8534_51740 [Lignipirellula cremea]
MGMHIGLVAAQTSVAELSAALLKACPNLELVASQKEFASADDLWAWKEANEQFVSAADWSQDTPGKSVYMFWQDGPWAILLDPDYTLASNDNLLQTLSSTFGKVLSFVVESAGGCAFFWCYENGVQRRQISNTDGEVTLEGEPLAEETGIDANNYYMEETEALWRAFGIAPYERLESAVGCIAISVIDRTDYSDL